MTSYPSDLEIANAAVKKPIQEIAKIINIDENALIKFGDDKACLLYTSPSPRDED